MSAVVRKTLHLSRTLAASLLLTLLCACSFYDYDAYETITKPAQTATEKYINLSIVVSTGNENVTRAPLGGENGDGREAGFERENKVTGITLMLYKVNSDDDDINSSLSEKIAFIDYYPVTEIPNSRQEAGTGYDKIKTDEVIYTTGEQLLTDFVLSGKYRAIVVANLNLTTDITTENTVEDVCEKTTEKIYDGNGLRVDAQNFVMASEDKGVLLDFTQKPTPEGNKIVYKFDYIRIERLAARVDFWMHNAKYNTDRKGYEYAVSKADGFPSNDKFVLTAVTPFNLYKDEAKEYFIKRTDDETNPYLADETTENCVIDPWTKEDKTASSSEYYKNPLSTLVENDKEKRSLANITDFYQTTQSLYESIPTDGASEEDKKKTQQAPFTENNQTYTDNFILCYPKENTLLPTAPLYYYATGIAIEGDYYKDGTGKPEHLIYYGYLRHQGEKESGSYTIQAADALDETYKYEDDQNAPSMNFSVVRNNIYRVYIDKITERGDKPEKPEIKWRIMVKNWDRFEHKTIFM